MNVYFVYKVLTNRIRALIIAAGYITRSRSMLRASLIIRDRLQDFVACVVL